MAEAADQTVNEERQLWELYILIGLAIALTALVTLSHAPRMSAWLLALVAVGIGQAIILPPRLGLLVGIAVIALWVIFRQVTGIWTYTTFMESLLSTVGLGVCILLGIRFHRIWQAQQDELKELRVLKRILVSDDEVAGLLPLEVARLRLLEEIDRARQFQRPMGLLIVELSSLTGAPVARNEVRPIVSAVARQVTSASSVHDTPFQQSANRIGLILPERNWEQLYADSDSIAESLAKATFIDHAGQSQPIHDYVKLSFGLGTYQGESTGEIDLIQAAEDSLSISRDLADVGAASASAFAMPASPIVEMASPISEAEE